ncbi:MAG TPA: PDZ domain-containing protein [Gemmatimonadaceae bacterium]
MRTLLLVTALVATAPVAGAQVRVQTAPGAYAYVLGDPDRPMIGVSTRSSGKRDTLGLLVESVTRDGPADKAGIEEGDRLVSVNSVNLRLSPADAGEPDMEGIANRRLIRELEKQKAGDEVELRVYRDGNTRTVRVRTVAAEELNRETFTARGAFSRLSADRAALGISLGGNGSRRDTLGILVVGVADDGPAARAGVDEGDRIASINGVDLRVAREDAGDRQASSVRINRLNREMEKLKAGDAVELRVVSGGQERTVRVEAVKASEIEGESFFFSAPGRTITIPRSRTRPPMVEYLEPGRARIRAEAERSVQMLKEALKQGAGSEARLKADLLRKLSTARALRIA